MRKDNRIILHITLTFKVIVETTLVLMTEAAGKTFVGCNLLVPPVSLCFCHGGVRLVNTIEALADG